MKKILVLSIIFCALYFTSLCQTIEGPVLKKELVGKYEGGQKKGLAHGIGTATGINTYTGNFRNGLPDGEGVYTDRVGNVYKGSFRFGKKEGKGVFTPVQSSNEKPIIGYWENDEYVGAEKLDPYEISNKTGSCNPRLYAAGAGKKVEICAINPVNSSYLRIRIFMIGDATERPPERYSGRYCFDDCNFPIEFDMRYNSPNKLGTGGIENTVRIKINKPGNWFITLRN
jgi:hypothetical protein